MTLRVKLIAAFVLLAVVPLSGVTLFSYAASVRAFEDAVRRESERATREMATRMTGVTAEVDRRLGEVPFERFAELERLRAEDAVSGDPARSAAAADVLVADVLRRMGGAARLVERVEFVPQDAPAPPAGGEIPPPPALPHPPGPVVIQLSTLWTSSDEPGAGEASRRQGPRIEVERRGDATILRPLGVDTAVTDAVADAAGLAWIQRVVDSIDVTARIDDPDAREALRQAAAQLESRRTEIEHVREVAEARPRADRQRVRERQADAVALEEPIRRDGEVLGTLRATMDANQVLRAVLGRAQRDQGEIPFAVGTDGELHTLDDESAATLRELGVDPEDVAGDGPRRLAGNWVVITRENPDTGIVFGLARPVGDSLDELRRTTGTNLAWGLGMVALAVIGIVPLSNRMTRHVTELSAGVDRLAGGDWSARVDVRSRDEIGRLGAAFNHMAGELDEQRRQLVTQERLRKEVEMCRQIQEDLLPRRDCRLSVAELQAVSIPARELGGDFFNYFALADGSIAFVMGDVSGKGVPAALMMANLQATLRARLSVEDDLARLADRIDHDLEASTPPETYLTLFVAVLSAAGDRLRFVNAGHNAQYLRRVDGSIERLESSGRPPGLLSGGGYTERELHVAPGDLLCLFTDGLVESPDRSDEFFGEERLEALLRDATDHAPAAIVTAIETAVATHRSGAEAADDATMLIARLVERDALA